MIGARPIMKDCTAAPENTRSEIERRNWNKSMCEYLFFSVDSFLFLYYNITEN